MNYLTKADYAYEEIKKMLLSGSVKADDRLVVADLAKEIEVSPMPVREALIRLAQERFVELIPHVGARVITYNHDKLKELHQLRCELESVATRFLAPIITAEQIQTLEALMEKGETAVRDEDIHSYYDWNGEFHLTVARMNPNKTLVEYIETLWENMQIISARYGSKKWRKNESFEEHRLWVEALITRDAVMAEAACRRHCSAIGELNIEEYVLESGREA